MKKLIICIMVCSVLLCGCVSDKEYEEMKSQYENQLAEKDSQISKLEKRYDSLKNDSSVQLSRIREAFFLENFEQVISLTEHLYETHPESDEYSEALDLSKTAQIRINNKEKAEQKQRQKEKQEEIEKTLRIYQSRISSVDSAGGVDIQISWENTSEKTVNYITFTVEVYNGVNDLISCEIKDESQFKLKQTGPMKPGEGSEKTQEVKFVDGGAKRVDKFIGTVWKNVLYNETAKKFVIKNILIEYSDNTNVEISEDDLKYAFY